MAMNAVRIYGREVGWSSFAVVARGFREGLGAHGALAGFVPVDTFDEYASYPGALAPAAVLCGPPGNLPDLLRRGRHKYRALVLAPNSSWVPEQIMLAACEICTELIAPSEWAAHQIRANMQFHRTIPVRVVAHGVLAGFAGTDYAAPYDRFRILHLTSSAFERKGTEALIRAFCAWERRGDAELRIVATERAYERWIDMPASPAGATRGVFVDQRQNLGPAAMGKLYRAFDVICQPSRAEGFGLVPLEARVAGVPVILTAATGHLQYIQSITDWATIAIPTGPLALIEEGDPSSGALAPTVEVEAITAALDQAFTNCDAMRGVAFEHAERIRAQWTWESTLAPWIRYLHENGKG
jgi:glycosyltransferase involved in cell wall biosynthesis